MGDPLIPGSDWTRIRVFPASIRSAKSITIIIIIFRTCTYMYVYYVHMVVVTYILLLYITIVN